MVEFAFSFALLMLLVVATAQAAILIHYGSSLDVASREGAFQAALAGHGLTDGKTATRQMWARLEPGAGQINVRATRSGRLIEVVATASAPALFPLPVPPFTHFDLSSKAAHSVETFAAGSQ
jgi:hypothetical protein